MKKFVLCALMAGLMLPAIAQEKTVSFKNNEGKVVHASEMMSDLGISTQPMLPINPTETLVDAGVTQLFESVEYNSNMRTRSVEVGGWAYAGTSQSYDRQTQGSVYPMTKLHSDGFIGTTWTNEDNSPFPGSSNPKRGIGYSYSTDGGLTWIEQGKRTGDIPLYWPSYAQWGPNGEAILGRSADAYEWQGVQIINGLVLMTRENKGVGDWTLHTVPYPAGTPSGSWTMAWARMTTSGNNHQYIHIMTHTRADDNTSLYQGYKEPVFYYRTQDGGATYDIAGELVPEIAGLSWHEGSGGGPSFTDKISIDARGNTVACSFVSMGYHAYMLKSSDNGNTWNATKFFHASARYYGTPAEYAGTCYIPCHGNVAVDNNGKVHIAFATRMASNSQEDGYITLFTGPTASFLSYWNEDMDPLVGGANYDSEDMDDLIWGTFLDEYLSNYDQLDVKSTIPELPIVGFYTPVYDDHYFYSPYDFDWILTSYGNAGPFSFPQMAFDVDNRLHLTYLGLLDGGNNDDRWFRHPFYTTTADGGTTWAQTEYLVNNIEYIDREFAYLTLAGRDNEHMYLMAQTDPFAGVYTAYVNGNSDHPPVTNYFTHFYIGPYIPPPPCNPITGAIANIKESCTSATLTWNHVPGAKKYEVRRDNTLLGTVTTPAFTEVFNFVDETTYTWKIKTICNENSSDEVSVSATANCKPCDPVTEAIATINNCQLATLTWTAVPEAKKYEIRRDNNLIGTVTSPAFTEAFGFEQGTTYTWKIKTVCDEGYESTEVSVSEIADCVGIYELANSVAIYPNPTTGELTIDNGKLTMEKIEIFDVFGRKLSTINCQLSIQQIDLSSYNTSIYFFKVYNVNNNSVTKRVMVTK
jgi:hypothetical protein